MCVMQRALHVCSGYRPLQMDKMRVVTDSLAACMWLAGWTCLFQVWSEVNQAVLDYENRESTPKLAKLLKLLLWAQNELDQKKVKYPKMTDLSKGVIEEPK